MTGYWIEKKKRIAVNCNLFPEKAFSIHEECFVYYNKYADEKAAIVRLDLKLTTDVGVINGIQCEHHEHSRTVWYCDVTDKIYDTKHNAMDFCAHYLGILEI